jgi:hypothetical protein
MRAFVGAMAVGFAILAIGGCQASVADQATSSGPMLNDAAGQQPLAESLFKSDQAVLSNQEINRILSSRVYAPAHARVAVVRIGGRFPWGRTWWSEDVAQIEQQGIDRMLNALRSSGRVEKVTVLPTMLTPMQVTIPYLREAAARVQADLLLVYRTSTQTYQRQQLFGGGTVHAYCTVEAVMLDTRSGIVTETAVKTQSFNAPRTSKDLEFEETAARAEQSAIAQALGQVAEQLSADLRAEPSAPASQPAFAGGDGKP